jgi:hypothetical protein
VKALLLAVVIAACGTDAAPISVVVPGQQALFTAKLGTAGWKAIAGAYDANANTTTYQIAISGDFELAVVCQRQNGTFDATNLFGTADDAEVTLGSWKAPDCVKTPDGILPPPTDQLVTITGMAPPNTTIAVDYFKHVINTTPFSFTTWPGIHDLIAYGNAEVLITHDVDLGTHPDLGAVPLIEQGAQVIAASYDLSGATGPDETVTAQTQISTRNGTEIYWNDPAASPTFIPASELAPGDSQSFTIAFGSNDGSSRSLLVTSFDPVPSGSDLLPRLGPATAPTGAVSATWTPLTEFYTTVTVFGRQNDSIQSVTASKLWMERHSTTQLSFDLAVDGYNSTWLLEAPSLYVQAERWTQGLELYARVTPTIAP